MENKLVDVSIVIISFNTKDITIDCLTSVIKNTEGINCEIVVVDNNSQDGSVEAIKKINAKKLFGNRNNAYEKTLRFLNWIVKENNVLPLKHLLQ